MYRSVFLQWHFPSRSPRALESGSRLFMTFQCFSTYLTYRFSSLSKASLELRCANSSFLSIAMSFID